MISDARLASFYERRGFAPAWTDPDAAAELLHAVRAAEGHGLDPSRYRLAALAPRIGDRSSWQESAAADRDLLLTDALLLLAGDLLVGRVKPEDRDPSVELVHTPREGDAVSLEALIAAPDIGQALAALAPDHYIYRGLRRELARYRSLRDAGGLLQVGDGSTLGEGDDDPSVAQLRKRLAQTGDLPAGVDLASNLFDADVARALRRFQHRHGLNEDVVLGSATRAELDVPVETRIDQIRVNLERARWVVRDLPESLVAVNIAGQRLYVVRDGAVVWETRVIVGKLATRTPTLSAPMQYLVLNPEWNVPSSIEGEIVADALEDPGFLERRRFELLDATGEPLDPAAVDLGSYAGERLPFRFRQRPGPGNALGQIKLVFPNPHSVYLHDTPSRSLFDRERRAFSHGCIRVQDPLRLAELVLDDPRSWSRGALETAVAGGETRTVRLVRPLLVLLFYWTAATDLHGELHFYRDVYGRDEAVLRALTVP